MNSKHQVMSSKIYQALPENRASHQVMNSKKDIIYNQQPNDFISASQLKHLSNLLTEEDYELLKQLHEDETFANQFFEDSFREVQQLQQSLQQCQYDDEVETMQSDQTLIQQCQYADVQAMEMDDEELLQYEQDAISQPSSPVPLQSTPVDEPNSPYYEEPFHPVPSSPSKTRISQPSSPSQKPCNAVDEPNSPFYQEHLAPSPTVEEHNSPFYQEHLAPSPEQVFSKSSEQHVPIQMKNVEQVFSKSSEQHVPISVSSNESTVNNKHYAKTTVTLKPIVTMSMKKKK